MKKTLIIFATAAALIISGCAANAAATSASPAPSGSAADSQPGESSGQTQPSEQERPTSGTSPAEAPQADSADPVDGMILDEYDGLKITAAVLPRKAILPGSVFPVTVTIANEGDKTISYIHGSSSYDTPNALISEFDGLQPVLPKDRLGISTSDFGVKQLKPGETLKFVVNVLAVEPDGEFDAKTHDLYNGEELYIAELEWADLQARYPELAAAEPGSYTGSLRFQYSIASGDDVAAMFGEPTGYAQASVTVGVTGN